MAKVAEDNFSFLFLFLDKTILPQPEGYKNAQEMEKALTQPNAMNHILVGIEYDDNMASKLTTDFLCLIANYIYTFTTKRYIMLSINLDATEFPDDIKVSLRFPAVMRTPMLEHPLRASWRTNLLFPLFPRPGPREPDDMYGGKVPGSYIIQLYPHKRYCNN